MPDRPLFTNAAALAGAQAVALSIANPAAAPTPTVAKVRLFDDSFIPDTGTTRAELIAAETTLTGYPAGGYDVEAFAAPTFAPLGGAVSTGPLINVAYASGPAVMIGGYWLEDDATTPNVREVFIYDPPRSLAVVGNGFPIVCQLGYGANAAV
jgi:hypothetical protein